MTKQLQRLKQEILCLSKSKHFIEFYDAFIAKQTRETYYNLVQYLKRKIPRKLVDKNINVYLLNDNDSIIYNAIVKKNEFDEYITNSKSVDLKFINKNFESFYCKDYLNFYDVNDETKNPSYCLLNSNKKFLITNYVYPTIDTNTPPTSTLAQIIGYYYWQGNFVGSSPKTQYYFKNVTAPQTGYQNPSNLVSTSGTFTYYGATIPSGVNTVILFTGYSVASDVLNNLTNYTTSTNMYDDAMTYFQNAGITDYLISLCFGGGVANTGGWNTGIQGAIYSIYQACTKNGMPFSYQETGTGNTLAGNGTGTITNIYNSFTFDIETWASNGSFGSSGGDFINLFNYLKNNQNSTFYTYKMIIIVSIAHSCSNYNGTGQQVISNILSDGTGSYDYISPQLYTQNVGTMTEYCANYNILWNNTGANDNFVYYLSQNKNFNIYGTNMIIPSLFYNSLVDSGGSNNGNSPNLYFYQSNSTNASPPVATASGWKTINYATDTGATAFFDNIFNTTNSLGGGIQWVNGTLV